MSLLPQGALAYVAPYAAFLALAEAGARWPDLEVALFPLRVIAPAALLGWSSLPRYERVNADGSTTSGDVLVNNVTAAGDTVTGNSVGAIEESGADGGADLTAATIDLNAATGIGAAWAATPASSTPVVMTARRGVLRIGMSGGS